MSKILLIEPNTVLAKTYTQALRHAGHEVAHVTGAQAAIDAADKSQPDLVIVELQLPQHNGVEFLHEFRSYAEWLHVPVVVNTALQPGRVMLSKEPLKRDLGILEFLYKPRTTLQDIVRVAREYTAKEAT